MKRSLMVLVAGLAFAGLGYGCFYFLYTAGHREMLASNTPELLWLKKEFKLTDESFSKIADLHAGYVPKCEERCRRIDEQNAQLKSLLTAATSLTPEIANILSERARMRAECEAEMLSHFFEVSRSMPPEQGRRYLAWVQEQTCLREPSMESQHRTAGESHH